MSKFFEFTTIKDGYPELVTSLFEDGNIIFDSTRESEEEKYTKNLHNVMITIKEPGFGQIPNRFLYNKAYMKEYAKQLLNPVNEKGFEYTYGEKLRSWPFNRGSLNLKEKDSISTTKNLYRLSGIQGIDQIKYIIKDLKKNKQSRRAIAITLFPPIDNFVDDIPCLQLTDFKELNGVLHLTSYFRSHDVIALPTNLYGLNELLNFVSFKTNLRPGTITIIDSSLHAYQRDWKYLLKIVYKKDVDVSMYYADLIYQMKFGKSMFLRC